MRWREFPHLTLNISKLVSSKVLKEGNELFKKGYASRLSMDVSNKKHIYITVRVCDRPNSQYYRTQIVVNTAAKNFTIECDCSEGNICRHNVAALLAYMDFYDTVVEPEITKGRGFLIASRETMIDLTDMRNEMQPDTDEDSDNKDENVLSAWSPQEYGFMDLPEEETEEETGKETEEQKPAPVQPSPREVAAYAEWSANCLNPPKANQEKNDLEDTWARYRENMLQQQSQELLSKIISSYQLDLLNDTEIAAPEQTPRSIRLVPVLANETISDGIMLSLQVRSLSPMELLAQKNENAEPRKIYSASNVPRAYIVRNLWDFLSTVRAKGRLNFGNGLSFIANMEAFDQDSEEMLHILLANADDLQLISTSRYRSTDRSMLLTNKVLDQLFPVFQRLQTRWGGSSYLYYPLACEQEAEIPLQIDFHKEEGSLLISCPEYGSVYPGHIDYDFNSSAARRVADKESKNAKFVYRLVSCQNNNGEKACQLARCSEKAGRRLIPVLNAVQQTRNQFRISGPKCVEFAETILAELRPYVELNQEAESFLGSMVKDELRGMIMLDAPEKDELNIILLANYGGILLDMYTGQAIGKVDEGRGVKANITWKSQNQSLKGIKRNYIEEKRLVASVAGAIGMKKDNISHLFQTNDPEDNKRTGVKASSPEEPFLISGGEQIYQFLAEGFPKLQKLGELLITERVKKLTIISPHRVSVGVSLNSGLLELNIEGSVDLDEYQALLKAYREKKSYYRMKNGTFMELTSSDATEAMMSFEKLDELQQGLQLPSLEGTLKVPAFRAMYLDGLFNEESGLDGKRSDAFRSLTKRIKEYAQAEFEIPSSLAEVLRPYQKIGYQWLKTMESCSFCGILADDMGLGKSVQFIALLVNAHENTPQGSPSLIVSPASLVMNWKKEMEKFAPQLPIRVVQGTASVRKALIEGIQPGETVITSYDLLKRDIESYQGHSFSYFAIDEAQFIKNHTTLAAKAVKQVVCTQRFALTGTPIENRLSELWSIFDFLMPGYLYKYTRFKSQFEVPISKEEDETAKENLRRMVRPFILRRLKSEVLTELPEKITTVIPVEMEEKQRELYKAAILTGIRSLKSEGKRPEGTAKMQVLALLTRLRRLCCDPSLCFEEYEHGSAKTEACMEVLEQAVSGGHRVLLFSQYTDMLDILEKRIGETEMTTLRLDGSTPAQTRVDLVDRFNAGEGDVFLISLKAGGTGLNLIGADTVILYDPWWNNAAQDQATDRAHRIGQKKTVQVFKLIVQDTIEDKILKLQEMKHELSEVIENRDSDDTGVLTQMSADEIIKLLKEH